MHRRLDAPAIDPAFAHSIVVAGVNAIHIERESVPVAEALAS
jgi:hypothetical protein